MQGLSLVHIGEGGLLSFLTSDFVGLDMESNATTCFVLFASLIALLALQQLVPK